MIIPDGEDEEESITRYLINVSGNSINRVRKHTYEFAAMVNIK